MAPQPPVNGGGECPKCKGRGCRAVRQLHHRESQQCEEMTSGDGRQQ